MVRGYTYDASYTYGAHCRLLDAAQSSYNQFNNASQNQYGSGVLAASMASTWVTVEVATCDEVVYPGELPVGLSTLLIHGRHSLWAWHWQPVSSLHVRAPPLVPCGPPAKGPVCSERELPSR
jgi:hypothetical protein